MAKQLLLKKKNIVHLENHKKALQFLYEESLSCKDEDIKSILEKALVCVNEFIYMEVTELPESDDNLLCYYFFRAILGLPSQKIQHLLKVLKWMTIISDAELQSN